MYGNICLKWWGGVVILYVLSATSGFGAYPDVVLSDHPVAYYRLNDNNDRSSVNVNTGTLGALGDATNNLPALHAYPGAITGERNRAAFFDGACRTEIAWLNSLNPAVNRAFTIEGWFYSASDEQGQCVLDSRSQLGGNVRGWGLFQGRAAPAYGGSESVGWQFRMHDGTASGGGLSVASQAPLKIGKWSHVAAVYNPLQITNATAIVYLDGTAAQTNTWNSTTTAYAPNTNSAAGLALGHGNSTAAANQSAFFGGIDEFAFYTNELTAAQIMTHYQNGTNASRSVAYDSLVRAASPAIYLRLDEFPPGADSAINLGETRSTGHGIHSSEVRHPVDSALAGSICDGAAGYHNRNGAAVTTIPWSAANNPDAGVPFTMEVWLKPGRDLQGGQCPLNNRYVHSGNRTGWVIYQRNPNHSYAEDEGYGWNFRMYYGFGSGGQNVFTDGADYKVGEWGHLVVTWEPQLDYGDYYENGNHQFQGVLTAYFNGQQAGTYSSALYAANVYPTEDGAPPADLAIGAYNAASGLGANPFEGEIDEFVFYTNFVLTADQVLQHYQAGTNAHPATNYETLILNPVPGAERHGPATYLRFNEPPVYGAADSATTGLAADAVLVVASNSAAGPRSNTQSGFESTNSAVDLNGLKQWVSLKNPDALNLGGQITLEAWINPAASQSGLARIISHGPVLLSDFLGASPSGAVTNGAEVFLQIDFAAQQYVVGSSVFTNGVGTNSYSARAAIPGGELGGGAWVHLVGTYDGAAWDIYRNGVLAASTPAPFGAILMSNADWAVGASGMGWANLFNGAIDEVAIYGQALSAQQVSQHYQAGISAGRLTINRSGNSLIVTWPYGTLQAAPELSGPWTPVPGNPSSPFTNAIGAGKKFYRF